MKTSARQFITIVQVLVFAGSAVADHALLSDGKILYNVSVPDGATTGGALVRVRTGPQSFGLDPATNSIYMLPPYSVSERLRDYVITSTPVGKEQALQIFRKRNWDAYRPPVAEQRLVAPTPAPKFTPPPVLAQPVATPIPLNVVPSSVPLDKRLDQQLDIFLAEQTTLAHDAATSIVQGVVSAEQAKQRKVELLQQQRRILEQYFPQTTDTVRLAVEYWGEQTNRAQQTGKFDLENL